MTAATSIPATERTPPIALTIAGSDSGGGAGIQADLRTFTMHRVHGTCAITCVTAQNTVGVHRVDTLPPEAIAAQIEAVATDLAPQAVKIGMLLNREIIEAVAAAIQKHSLTNVVVDPVMVSRAGAQLLADKAIASMRALMLPSANVLTPNRYEAQILSGLPINTLEDMQAAARKIHTLGPQSVLVKGGSMTGDYRGTDVWFDGDRLEIFETAAIATTHTHGTGCTLSAAIAAQLALGQSPKEAILRAKQFVTEAIANALAIGSGQGPIGHFYARPVL
ncbi:bifunctional hydroxymethylpyrimidine kinase/phosphomethylpyrimidine kinase [Synechococcus sp. PCC 7336]|uniref:bifunctional hydroxymethylpyrimidine kinase/phosphomethylpyrimidine kinase n=1 Tax=Synechococcus sp. PCC 7336 TaxID=195250 RepID=UPI0003497E94|nr:bifunctional hydroxymethylpyrimidine kinase/phosphomethylpyrimidine kinase [Synechococcus sp. PCC 7336]